MNLNINKLKKNPLLNHLIQLREMNEFKSSAPRILIVIILLIYRTVTCIWINLVKSFNKRVNLDYINNLSSNSYPCMKLCMEKTLLNSRFGLIRGYWFIKSKNIYKRILYNWKNSLLMV